MLRKMTLIATLAASPAFASDDILRVAAEGDVSAVMDRLETAVTGAGATVFARVDHGQGAASVEMELADAELLIFGNPRLGTPAMQADIHAGIFLPLRVLVYADAEGQTWLAYEAPREMLGDLAIPADAPFLGVMEGALQNLTGAAAGG